MGNQISILKQKIEKTQQSKRQQRGKSNVEDEGSENQSIKQIIKESLTPEQLEALKLKEQLDWIDREKNQTKEKYEKITVIINQGDKKLAEYDAQIDKYRQEAKQYLIMNNQTMAKNKLKQKKGVELNKQTYINYQSKYLEQQTTLETYIDVLKQLKDTILINKKNEKENLDKLTEELQEAGIKLNALTQGAQQIRDQSNMINQESEGDDDLLSEFAKLQEEIAQDAVKDIYIENPGFQQQQLQVQNTGTQKIATGVKQ